jgi:hypothetical protein
MRAGVIRTMRLGRTMSEDVSITDLAEFVGHQTDEAMEAWERYRSSPSTPGWEKFPVAWIEQDAFIAGWGARTVYVEPVTVPTEPEYEYRRRHNRGANIATFDTAPELNHGEWVERRMLGEWEALEPDEVTTEAPSE